MLGCIAEAAGVETKSCEVFVGDEVKAIVFVVRAKMSSESGGGVSRTLPLCGA